MVHERRKDERFDITLDVAIKASKYSEELFAGAIKNISSGGFCIESPDITPLLKTPVEVMVKLPVHDSAVSLTGNVAWDEQLDNKCLFGVELTRSEKEATDLILDYAFDLMSDKQSI